jgi:transcriptional regulator with XRE-family HTH domain
MAAEYVARMGARIRERREELGMTQRELADAIPGKADSNQVSKWERGGHRPSDSTLEHIAKALKVTPAYFMVSPATAAGSGDLMEKFSPADPRLDRLEAKINVTMRALAVSLRADRSDAAVDEVLREMAEFLEDVDDRER